MNEYEKDLVAYLTEMKGQKLGFMELRTDVEDWCADIDLDASYEWCASQCIFDDCTDAQAKFLLTGFVNGQLRVSWSVSEQLSKLLSKRGLLIREIMEPLLTTLDWRSIGTYLLFLSYLAVKEDGEVWASRLLDEVPDDGRDGLFVACYRLHSEELDRKLMSKFLEWHAEEVPGSMAGTGCMGALGQFIAKWLPIYPYKDLEQVIRIYFAHVRRN